MLLKRSVHLKEAHGADENNGGVPYQAGDRCNIWEYHERSPGLTIHRNRRMLVQVQLGFQGAQLLVSSKGDLRDGEIVPSEDLL